MAGRGHRTVARQVPEAEPPSAYGVCDRVRGRNGPPIWERSHAPHSGGAGNAISVRERSSSKQFLDALLPSRLLSPGLFSGYAQSSRKSALAGLRAGAVPPGAAERAGPDPPDPHRHRGAQRAAAALRRRAAGWFSLSAGEAQRRFSKLAQGDVYFQDLRDAAIQRVFEQRITVGEIARITGQSNSRRLTAFRLCPVGRVGAEHANNPGHPRGCWLVVQSGPQNNAKQ